MCAAKASAEMLVKFRKMSADALLLAKDWLLDLEIDWISDVLNRRKPKIVLFNC